MYMLRVKEILKEKGMTQKELAERMGVAEISLSRSISVTGNPSLDTLRKIAKSLNVDISELFGGMSLTCPRCGAILELKEKKL